MTPVRLDCESRHYFSVSEAACLCLGLPIQPQFVGLSDFIKLSPWKIVLRGSSGTPNSTVVVVSMWRTACYVCVCGLVQTNWVMCSWGSVCCYGSLSLCVWTYERKLTEGRDLASGGEKRETNLAALSVLASDFCCGSNYMWPRAEVVWSGRQPPLHLQLEEDISAPAWRKGFKERWLSQNNTDQICHQGS